MAADKVKTAFRLSSGVNEVFIRNLIWQLHQQQQHQKVINQQQQQNTNQLTSEDVSKYTREKTCAEVFFLFNKVSGLQSAALSKKRLRLRCFLVKLPRAHFFFEYLRTTASERTQDFTNNGPSSNSY